MISFWWGLILLFLKLQVSTRNKVKKWTNIIFFQSWRLICFSVYVSVRKTSDFSDYFVLFIFVHVIAWPQQCVSRVWGDSRFIIPISLSWSGHIVGYARPPAAVSLAGYGPVSSFTSLDSQRGLCSAKWVILFHSHFHIFGSIPNSGRRWKVEMCRFGPRRQGRGKGTLGSKRDAVIIIQVSSF